MDQKVSSGVSTTMAGNDQYAILDAYPAVHPSIITMDKRVYDAEIQLYKSNYKKVEDMWKSEQNSNRLLEGKISNQASVIERLSHEAIDLEENYSLQIANLHLAAHKAGIRFAQMRNGKYRAIVLKKKR